MASRGQLIGLILAGTGGLLAALCLIKFYLTPAIEADVYAQLSALWLMAGAFGYFAMRALGWAVAGFFD